MLSELINTGPTLLALSAIVNDGGTQMRAGMNADTVKEYEDALTEAEAWPFPPVIVYHDGARYWLADGFHRLNAAHRSGKFQEIPADIKPGTRRDAILFAAGANASHGLRRSKDDRQRAVKALVLDDEWGKWSNREIARRCNVDEKLVRQVKKDLGIDTADNPQYTHPKTGETTTMQTANIGTNRPAPPVMLAVWELQATVREVYAQVYGGNPEPYATRDMRTGAQMRAGRFWLLCTQSLPANQFRLSDLAQAINNVAAHVEAQRDGTNAKPNPILRTYSEYHPPQTEPAPETPDRWAEALEQRKYDTLDLRCNRLAAAMLPWAMEWTDDKGRTWQDVATKNPQHANSPFRQDVETECKRRGIPIFEEATALTIRKLFDLLQTPETPADVVVNGDRPLPEWVAEDSPAGDALEETLRSLAEPEQPATAAQTVADVVEVHGEPVPAPEPVEVMPVSQRAAYEPVEVITPVSQRADYESDEWYTPGEYINAAVAVMGAIDLDPASSEMAQTVVRAGVYLTRFDDGLAQVRWIHQRIWLNPPYSNPAPWIEKLVREHQAGPFCTEAIVLVNNATETSWFQLLLERFPVCLPARRLAFWRHDHANVGARQGQAFFYLGPNGDRFEEVFRQFGPILRRVA